MRWQVLFKSHIYYSYPVIYLLLVGRCPEHVPHVFNLAVFGQAVLIVFSVTSGGRLAVLIYFSPIPANSIFPCDNSPLSCLNSSCPLESCSRVCIRSRLVNFMYTRLLCPSIWIIRISSSAKRKFSQIHSCIWNAVIRGLLRSKQHKIVFCLSFILAAVFSLIAPLHTDITQTLHYLLARSALLCLFNTTAQFHY